MAQRFKATDLKEMIRAIVREEIKDVVGRTINEVLSERYLREVAKRVTESVAVSRPRGVASLEQFGEDAIEEPPPHPLANSREWPFEKHVMKHDDAVETDQGEDQDRDREDPMSMFFEGTRSLKEIEEHAPSEEDLLNKTQSAPIPGSKKLEEQKQIWTQLAGVKSKKKKEEDVDAAAKAQFEEARIKRMREELDRKA